MLQVTSQFKIGFHFQSNYETSVYQLNYKLLLSRVVDNGLESFDFNSKRVLDYPNFKSLCVDSEPILIFWLMETDTCAFQ